MISKTFSTTLVAVPCYCSWSADALSLTFAVMVAAELRRKGVYVSFMQPESMLFYKSLMQVSRCKNHVQVC